VAKPAEALTTAAQSMGGNEASLPERLVFTAENCHDQDCGLPPDITRRKDDPAYYGYYENDYGEQFIVKIDRSAGVGVVRGGDLGWQTPIEIIDDRVGGGVILGDREVAWLKACWAAATGRELQYHPGMQGEP
jgi:hypothetical protein